MRNAILVKPCIFAILAMLSQLAFAAPAGSVTFKVGDATITHADKTVVQAVKNAELNAGDTIETKDGRLQLALIDGGKVSLQPNTIYKINKYEFASGKEDGSEYGFTELIKGGLRTVSGLIGHKNRDRYQLKTAVATIGIRGTEFSVNFNDNNLLMTTNHGSVDVCNAGGCLNAVTGQSIEVAGAGASPKPSDKKAKSSAAPPAGGKAVFAASDSIDVVALANSQALANYNGPGFLSTVMKTTCVCRFDGVYEANIQTDANSKPTLSTFNIGANTVDLQPLSFSSYNSDGIVAWGRTSGGTITTSPPIGAAGPTTVNTIEWMDYAIGQKPNMGSLANLTGTYNVFASTAPIMVSGSTSTVVGAANTVTGNIAFNFSTNNLTYGLTVLAAGESFVLGGGASLNANNPAFASNNGIVRSIGSSCGAGCSGIINGGNLVQGAFFGPNGERIGLQYGFNVPANGANVNNGNGSGVPGNGFGLSNNGNAGGQIYGTVVLK